MSKYQFHRMNGESFEQMVQALLEKQRRNHGGLIQFGSGADGSREATWLQPPDHPDYTRPKNAVSDVAKHWIFQAKFHEIGLRGWKGAGSAIVSDLKTELEKLTQKHAVKCDHYILITNVPLSGARNIGTRDQVTKVAEDWESKIPKIEIWDAVDLSRMLDNNQDVRQAYLELILPGDVLAAIFRQADFQADRRKSTFAGYLKYLITSESKARADEAGDEEALPLSKVFVDQSLRLNRDNIPASYREIVDSWSLDPLSNSEIEPLLPQDLNAVASSCPLLWAAQPKVMLLAGPGYGKSTITQFLALYHASRLIDHSYALKLAQRLKLPQKWDAKTLDAFCEMRYPFRIELRRYAKWRKVSENQQSSGIATYIARELIGRNVASTLVDDDIFDLTSRNPILLILDGLDEVPNKELRDQILKDCDAFIHRCSGEDADMQIIMSSRPQGYNGEFDRFDPLKWEINDLERKDFDRYCTAWLNERINNADERLEAEERIKRGMNSEAVTRLATTLLQATVMLTIVRRKSDIPEERHKLFEKYVDVVFQREKTKSDLISEYETELRRLHEVVRYRLHEAVGRGDEELVPEARFRDFVREIWHLLRGDRPSPNAPNDECNQIVELATDRLVFLSGKGENQTDIDFVIQPYREYFAAQYLNFHTEADPDKVYNCLVERGPFWINVLQFFAALAKPAQQVAWIHRINDDVIDESHFIDRLIRDVEYKRATLAAMPEYVRLSPGQFRKAVSMVLHQDTWWTWMRQEWAINVMRTLRSGEVRRELFSFYSNSGPISRIHAFFAIWILPKITPKNSPEYQTLTRVILELTQDKEFSEQALSVALLYDMPVNFSFVNFNCISRAISDYHLVQRHGNISKASIISRMPRAAAIRLLSSSGTYFPDGTSVWTYIGLPVETEIVEFIGFETIRNQPIVVTPPSWVNFKVQEQTILRLHSDAPCHDRVEKYFVAVYDALSHPDSKQHDKKARSIERKIRDKLSWNYRVQNMLGPMPSRFLNEFDWSSYRNNVKAFFRQGNNLNDLNEIANNIASAHTSGEHVWCALLFHPSQWNVLVQHGLVSEGTVKNISGFEWAKLMAIPTRFEEIANYSTVRYHQTKTLDIPSLRILSVVAIIHSNGMLGESSLASVLSDCADVSKIDPHELTDIIHNFTSLESLPDTWARFLFMTTLFTPGIDAEILTKLWVSLNQTRKLTLWIRFNSERKYNIVFSVVRQLLDLNTDTSILLASSLWSHLPEFDNELSRLLNSRVASILSKDNWKQSTARTFVNCLLITAPTLSEIQLYAQPFYFKALSSLMRRFPHRAADKIVMMPQKMSRSDYPALKLSLEAIVGHFDNYPLAVTSSALDALIQIDYSIREPLTERMWQFTE